MLGKVMTCDPKLHISNSQVYITSSPDGQRCQELLLSLTFFFILLLLSIYCDITLLYLCVF